LALLLACPALAQTEGEGEGTTPDCALEELTLLTPRGGATWFLNDTSAGLDVSLLAEADCPEDVDSVSFFVRQGDGAPQPIGSPDETAPFEAAFSSFFTPTIGQVLTWRAEARRVSTPTLGLATESTVTLQGTDQADLDDNGLPDTPFGAMNSSDDRWYTVLALEDEDDRVVTWMRAFRGDDDAALPDKISATLRSPESTGQNLTVTFDRDLLDGTQLGLLVVCFAPTLSALVGSEEVEQFSREPSGDLNGAGQYFAVSVLVSNTNGSTFNEVAVSRLQANPIEFTLTGLDLDATREYTVAGHSSQLTVTTDSLELLAKTGAWQSISEQDIDLTVGTATGSIEKIGVYTPYVIVDEDELCPLGFCLSGSIIIELLTILALAILNLVPGGVGGGESPCFIATAAYGTPLAADIDLLRAVRDEWLLSNPVGTAFTDAYYRTSPPLADFVAQHGWAAIPIRTAIMITVGFLKLPVMLLGTALLLGVGWWRSRASNQNRARAK
jgi:hypothetical protein